ncbi:hypothetical protein O181_013898 [Austropuccinia psidii MF-1]|uniref:Integrase catalytic domain-containing protein n=1 Tax=Austropuccinia psidii MF-1 TaxID=1389203 RepID=A0A9Q3BZK6_9BASI|nr:hypothetical protein [Austropuccinia psidii MF-1]
MSSVYHPETDGQTERVNQILQQYLWMYVSYHQDDWDTWLPLAESSYNNSDHSSTKQSPLFTVYGREPHFGSVQISQDTPSGKFKWYAKKNRESPAVFNPVDMVWLSSKSIKSTRTTKKLSERLLGPFPILKKAGTNAHNLKLPSHWKFIHPVFHISLLEPFKTSTIPNWHQEPPPPIIIED